MKPIKDYEHKARSTITWSKLLDKYENGLATISPAEVAFLFAMVKQHIRTVYHQRNTIERLEQDINDIIHVRDALQHWHKVHDEAMRLRKEVQVLKERLKKYEDSE